MEKPVKSVKNAVQKLFSSSLQAAELTSASNAKFKFCKPYKARRGCNKGREEE